MSFPPLSVSSCPQLLEKNSLVCDHHMLFSSGNVTKHNGVLKK